MALKGDAFIVDLARFAERHDLISPRIRENTAAPAHELVQAAHALEECRTGP